MQRTSPWQSFTCHLCPELALKVDDATYRLGVLNWTTNWGPLKRHLGSQSGLNEMSLNIDHKEEYDELESLVQEAVSMPSVRLQFKSSHNSMKPTPTCHQVACWNHKAKVEA
eukprot:3027629-Amphidinium_carterae.1